MNFDVEDKMIYFNYFKYCSNSIVLLMDFKKSPEGSIPKSI